MANIKYFSEFRSSHGLFYKIEIWDEDYTGNDPIEFNVTSNGFDLNYSGQTDNIYSPIIGSSVSLGMYIKNDDHESLVESLKQYQEHRFYIKIRRYKPEEKNDVVDDFRQRVQNDDGTFEAGGCVDDALAELGVGSETLTNIFVEYHKDRVESDGGIFEGENCTIDAINALGGTKDVPIELYDFYWGGYITQDIVEIEDASKPYVLNIQATDGINKLKNVEAEEGYTPLTNIFANAIFYAYTWNIFPEDYPMLKTISNWWSQQHTYDADDDPLDATVIDLNTFHTYDNDGNLQKATYYEVLESVCRIFGIRFYFSNGSFRAEQIFERDNNQFKEFSYKRNGNPISFETKRRDKTINQTSNAARLAGNTYSFLPAVNKTQIVIDRFTVDANGVKHTNVLAPEIDLGFVPNDSANKLMISTNRNVDLEVPTFVQDTTPFYAIIDMDVKLEGALVTYYLKRDHTGTTPNAMQWTTTQAGSGLQLLIGPFYEDFDQSVNTSGTHTTPPLPVSGDVTINTSFNKFIRTNGNTYTLAGTSDKQFQVEYVAIQTSNDDGFTQQTNTVTASTTNGNVESGLVYDLGETKIYDALGARGSLFERDPGTLVQTPTTGWRIGNSGSYKKVQNLVTEEFLRLMNAPIQRYQGQIFSAHHFDTRLVFDNLNWVQMGGRFNANRDEWDGEWFAISQLTITITATDVGNTSDPVFRIGSSTRDGVFVADSVDIANIHADDITTTGTVDVGANLDVTGNSTLATTSVGEFTSTDRVNVTINEITANPGGSETLSLRNHFNFISYEGENGTYTINLPAAESGVILRFKTDDSVLANKTITLQPQSGQRVDAEASYTMDRSYDGITLLGHNDNWFVIQKKEK